MNAPLKRGSIDSKAFLLYCYFFSSTTPFNSVVPPPVFMNLISLTWLHVDTHIYINWRNIINSCNSTSTSFKSIIYLHQLFSTSNI